MNLTRLKRLIFVKWGNFKLSTNPIAVRRRESHRILTQARHYNGLVAQRGSGMYRSVVMKGRRH